MSHESDIVPRFPPDFAARVVRQAKIERGRQRRRRRVGMGLGAMVALAVAAFALQSPMATRLHPRSTFTILDIDDNASTTDGVLSLIDGANETQGDDPAGYFFPDSEALMASATD